MTSCECVNTVLSNNMRHSNCQEPLSVKLSRINNQTGISSSHYLSNISSCIINKDNNNKSKHNSYARYLGKLKAKNIKGCP